MRGDKMRIYHKRIGSLPSIMLSCINSHHFKEDIVETQLMQLQSFCILVIMIAGIYWRRKRTLHIRTMSVAMIWDVVLILQIELSRSAIIKASKVINNHLALNIHVSIAVTTVVLYGIMIYTGRKLLQGHPIRREHRTLGYVTFFMRVLTFATSFLAVVPKE